MLILHLKSSSIKIEIPNLINDQIFHYHHYNYLNLINHHHQ